MTGRTLAAIIGYPLDHSMSPPLHNAGFAALGLNVHYEAWPIPIEELPATVERLRSDEMLGISVTVPYKQAVMPLLDEIDPAADAIGSVNTLVRRGRTLVGYNTDKDGFIRSLREAGCDPAGLRALVLGVGGAERAVAYGLVEAGVASIALAGRRPDRVAAAAGHLAVSTPHPVQVDRLPFDEASLTRAAAEAGLIVNTTPIGMRYSPHEHESPLPAAALRPGLWVVDIVYNPLETVLLRLAREAGAHAVDGLGMLVYQGVAQQELWTGREPPGDIMREAALAAMMAQE
ncbi:MAG TPA: shikimate dehydrogenase [Dehalococcoidia bacterium]|nr:shikimate dehydrogenase [Dehalococcoidia bacterium]